VNAVIIPLGREPAEPSRDDWQKRVLALLLDESRVVRTGDLRNVAGGHHVRDYLRWLQREGFITYCGTCGRKSVITVHDYAALRRLARHPRPLTTALRTTHVATSKSTVT
jgi:hypothetical protein